MYAERKYIGTINSAREKYTSKIEKLSKNTNLASEIGTLCHIFRDIDVFSAFPEVALLGATLVKALTPSFFACSPLIGRWTAP